MQLKKIIFLQTYVMDVLYVTCILKINFIHFQIDFTYIQLIELYRNFFSGLINYILSLKLWIPLSRMTYMIYLVSPIIQAHYGANLGFPEDFSDIKIVSMKSNLNYFTNK